MAKMTNFLLVIFGEIIWKSEMNLVRQTRDYGSEKERAELRQNLALAGWLQDPNGCIEAQPVPEDWIGPELANRQKQLELYQSDPLKSTELKVFKALFCDSKGKLLKPKYDGVVGNRRGAEYFQSQVERLQLLDPDTKEPLGLEVVNTVPLMLGDYSDPLVRIEAQTRENVLKTKGRKASNPVDDLLTAKLMFGSGYTQSKMRQVFSSPTMGVKHYWTVRLDAMFRDIQLIDRIKLDPKDSSYIPYQKIMHSDLQSMGSRLTPEDTEAFNKRHSREEPKPVFSKEELEEYIVNLVRDGKGNPNTGVKAMDKNAIANIGEGNDSEIVRIVANAIANNRKDSLMVSKDFAPATNAVMELMRQGDLPQVEKILLHLKGLEKGEMRDAAFKAVNAALGL